MTPSRSPRRATADSWTDVLANAEQQLVAAKNTLDLAEPGKNAKPVAAAAVIAAVGFADAVTVQPAVWSTRGSTSAFPTSSATS